ncbi:hypothetical protein ACP70R_026226 [Stipagrostis hirtigluma subsp. patula]
MEDKHRKMEEGDSEKAAIKPESDGVEKGAGMPRRPGGGRGSYEALTFDLVSRHFSMPIKQAAKELNVGVTLLKSRCRELGISRWPHRKVKSMQRLIETVQELGKEVEQGEGDVTRNVVEFLQDTKQLIEKRPDETIDQETRRFGQACFKAKRMRLMTHG